MTVFTEVDGILRCTIQNLFECIPFYYQRRSVFLSFFKGCMSDPDSSTSIIKLLFDLSISYLGSYSKVVTGTTGSIEKRQRAGKMMIQAYESERIVLRDVFRVNFASLSCIRKYFDLKVDIDDESFEESNILFGFLELHLSDNFWKWVQLEKKQHWSDYIKERDNDTSFVYSAAMKDKIYDITGYLCSHRVSNLLKHNKLRNGYKETFIQFHTQSRYDSGTTAVKAGLPARYLLFRQHSGGLYFSRVENFNFISIVQTIFMQSLTTDVLILFNSIEPVKKAKEIILNSINAQDAFKKSCFTLQHSFTEGINLATGKSPISFLFQFLITGFLRVYSKDIYQIRLSNVLLSKSGASGVRTGLLTLSAVSEKKKRNEGILQSVSAVIDSTPSLISGFISPCGRRYKENKSGWYKRHLTTCPACLSSQHNMLGLQPLSVKEAAISAILDERIELESLEEFDDFDEHIDLQEGINLEIALEQEENTFDAEFISGILNEE